MQKTARVIEGVTPDQIPWDELFAAGEPVVLRGLVASWPLVQAGLKSAEQAMELMAANYSGRVATVYIGDPDIKARFGYDESCTGLNYRAEKMNLLDVFQAIRNGFGQAEHPYYYINSLVYSEGFPGLQQDNNLPFEHPVFENNPTTRKIWIGTETRASAHYDMPINLACCLVGTRRFTLFPPNQVHNLYPGPFHPTPGGQVITMADLKNPDYETYPRFRQAVEASVVADLEPGDALYYPSMWWHEVEGKAPFNVMVNHWWMVTPRYLANPMEAVMYAILAVRDRPEQEKQAWRELFEYYVFGPPDKPREHLPEACRGVLAELDENQARRLRAQLQHGLNR